jgi:hypothetical protein
MLIWLQTGDKSWTRKLQEEHIRCHLFLTQIFRNGENFISVVKLVFNPVVYTLYLTIKYAKKKPVNQVMEITLYVCAHYFLSFYVFVWNIIDQHKYQELILFTQYTALEKPII